jgi:hypothetical protein
VNHRRQTVFLERFALVEEAHNRYHRALDTLPPGSSAHRKVEAGAAKVLAELERAERLTVLGDQAPHYDSEHGAGRARRGRDPSRRLTRRQLHSPRDRHLHNLDLSLIKLMRAADAAVAVAVAAALAAHDTVDSEVDDELAALAEAIDELR